MLIAENEKVENGEGGGYERIEQDRAQALQRSIELDNKQCELTELTAAIDKAATVLEEQIRQLGKEEAEFKRRKKTLQHDARSIGDRRTELIGKTKDLAKERESLTRDVDQLDQHQKNVERSEALVEQERAFEESMTGARIECVESDQDGCEKAGMENRKSKRMAVAVDVSFHTEHNFFMGLTENLSEGGLFVATYDNIPIGTELQVQLNLPDSDTINAQGVIRWVREYSRFTEDLAPGVGLELVDLDDGDQAVIREFLSQRDPIYYETA
jgi:uncharacterized protein (TIGR02266 family)